MPSVFAQAFSNARERLFSHFAESVMYSAGGASAVPLLAVAEVSPSPFASQPDGAGRNLIVMFKIRTADAPNFADGDTLEWDGRTYILRMEEEDNGIGIFTARGASYEARTKGRSEPFIRRT